MSRVGIVTDTTCCLPEELTRRYGIRQVPVGMVMNGKLYRDMIDITPAEFWKAFPTLKEEPSTAAGSPGDFVKAFTELSETTNDILCILVSKALTATHESAYLARKLVKADHPELNIAIIDSRTSAGGLAFIVLEAARAAEQGKSLDEVLSVVDDMSSRVIYLSCVETLKYMIKNGRAPRNAEIGEMLGVKPIIGFVDDTGTTEVVARVGGRDNALKKMVDMVKKYTDTKLALHLMVHYCDDERDAEQLRAMMETRYKCSEVYVSAYTPVVVAATGRMVGMAFYS